MAEGRAAIIASVGAGRMGRGIAHAFAYAGHAVRLVDIKPRSPEDLARLEAEARAEIGASLTVLAGAGVLPAGAIGQILSRISIHGAAEAGGAIAGADVVFEGVPETEAAKREALAVIDRHADPAAVVASTTSTFLSSLLAGMSASPQRFLNAHWLNPAYLVPLVEVSPHAGTDPDVTRRLVDLLTAIGKVPVVCKASPGYIVPRIQALAMNEAARLVAEGVASAEDIDKAILYGFGVRFSVLGLVEFIDWGGGDILYYASRYMAQATGEDRFNAPPAVEENMAQGRIGMKTGQGFYDWAGTDVEAHRKRRIGEFVGLLRHLGQIKPPVL
ncbi:MAG: 3-hydroxybutyryl-CoA dehydrogenase [Hyphomicrobiaceae bacterium]|nr:3-hydroxybutyryl-CoA dehydrogenase [Hyphomicrobiaceae bacterium]